LFNRLGRAQNATPLRHCARRQDSRTFYWRTPGAPLRRAKWTAPLRNDKAIRGPHRHAVLSISQISNVNSATAVGLASPGDESASQPRQMTVSVEGRCGICHAAYAHTHTHRTQDKTLAHRMGAAIPRTPRAFVACTSLPRRSALGGACRRSGLKRLSICHQRLNWVNC
jgi:hypothetical protein